MPISYLGFSRDHSGRSTESRMGVGAGCVYKTVWRLSKIRTASTSGKENGKNETGFEGYLKKEISSSSLFLSSPYSNLIFIPLLFFPFLLIFSITDFIFVPFYNFCLFNDSFKDFD